MALVKCTEGPLQLPFRQWKGHKQYGTATAKKTLLLWYSSLRLMWHICIWSGSLYMYDFFLPFVVTTEESTFYSEVVYFVGLLVPGKKK